MQLNEKQVNLALEYARLAARSELSDLEAERMSEILELSQFDDSLCFLANEIDEFIFQQTNSSGDKIVENHKNIIVKIEEFIEIKQNNILDNSSVGTNNPKKSVGYSSRKQSHLSRLTSKQKSLIKEYSELATRSKLSDSEAERMSEILEKAQSDDVLSLLINEVDSLTFQELNLFRFGEAGSYYIKIYSGDEASTDYNNLNLSAIPDRDTITGFSNPSFDTGVFTVGYSGQVSIDYLFDGGAYQGDLAIFSLEGMEQFDANLNEFIAEAARRALSNIDSDLIAGLAGDTNPVVSLPVNSDVTSAEPIDSELIANSPVESQPVNVDLPASNQPLVGIINTDFSANSPDIRPLAKVKLTPLNPPDAGGRNLAPSPKRRGLGRGFSDLCKRSIDYNRITLVDYSRITLGSDRIDNDDNPLTWSGEGKVTPTERATATEFGGKYYGWYYGWESYIDGVNDKAPIWIGRALGSGQWAELLVEFVNAARNSNQPNAVVNLSMDLTQVNPDGSVTTRYELTPQEQAAIEYARQYNVLIVAAAGNDGGVMSVLGQASQEFDNIITVGSAQDFDPSIAPAEGFNRTDYSSYGYGLDIMANGGTTVGAGVGTMAGTSVATAEVTGAVSQVWAANPQLSYRQVIEIIKSTATDLDTPNWDAITGAGLLNLVAAVLLAKVTTPLEYDAPATVIPATWSGEGKVTPTERATATEFRDKYYEWESYKVQRGDTLSAIALRTMGNGTKPYYDFIARRNGIANPDQLPEGITIYIPREVSYCG